MSEGDIIAALATAPGRAALAVVRVSGPGSIELVGGCLRETDRFFRAPERHVGLYRALGAGRERIVDEVTAVKMPGPRSYTGEDMVEVTCHGGDVVVKEILGALWRAGARPAGRGEFTRRALLWGKINVLRAEATRAIIESRTGAGLRSAVGNYMGGYGPLLGRWKSELEDILAGVEALIEFPDEDDLREDAGGKGIRERLAGIERELREQLGRARAMRRAVEGIVVPIVGAKNAGKSTLFNLLLDEDRAIVHSDAGTTRDAVGERVNLEGMEITLVDTAGLGTPGEEIEGMGIRRAWAHGTEAEIVLWVSAAGRSITEEERELARKRAGRETIGVISKTDQGSPGEKKKFFREVGIRTIEGCMVEEAGRRSIREEVSRGLTQKCSAYECEAGIIQGERQEALAEALLDELRVLEGGGRGVGEEVAAERLRKALRVLGELSGDVTTEEILDRVFERFCIGK